MTPNSRRAARRRRILTRAVPIAVVAVIAFVAGALVAGGSPEQQAAERFLDAWTRQDFTAMHAELTPDAASEYAENEFRDRYLRAQGTATVTGIGVDEVRDSGGGVVTAEVTIETSAFGRIAGELELPARDGALAWRPAAVFPGLEDGERLRRRTEIPPRAPILASDGTPLVEGPVESRRSKLGAAANVTGEIGTPKRERAAELAERGFPPGALAGTSGLELAFDTRLAGQPGGTLLASAKGAEDRVLASSDPMPGKPVRTTIEPALQEAAVSALGSRFGGVAAIDAESGQVLGVAGVAFSAPQPPGSTFKIVTTVAALEDDMVSLNDQFPVVTAANVGGREIANAHDELCGGNFVEAFAHSCNSVFAPLGAEIGPEKLLEVAERFGFNSPPQLYNQEATDAVEPPASTIPDPIGSDLEVGVSAIGQGMVLATPLQLASMSQTIAADGKRSPTPIVRGSVLGPDAEPVRVTSPKIARTVRDLMVGVVADGTGASAAIPGVEVAGKTGTAEIGPSGDPAVPGQAPEQDVDAWFTAFAPAGDPEVAVAVMIVDADGDGGTVAAPIARQVIAAALES